MSPLDGLTLRGFLGDEPAAVGPEGRAVTELCEVHGRVKGSAPEGSIVRAELKTLRHGGLTRQIVAETVVDSAGSYRIEYERPVHAPDSAVRALCVRLYSPDERQLAESAPIALPACRVRVDLRPRRTPGGESEYSLLERRIAEGLEAGVTALEGAEPSAVEDVAGWLDVDAERLLIYQQARTFENETGIPAAAFYALGRAGAGPSPDDLLDVPIQELRTTLDEAVATGVIDGDRLGNLDALIEHLAECVMRSAVQPGRDGPRAGLAEVLASADLPPDVVSQVLRRYQAREGHAAEFWDSFVAGGDVAEAIGDDTAREVETAVRLGALVGPDPSLLRQMHDLRKEGRWQSPEDLSRFTFDDWCDVLEDLEWSQDGGSATESEAGAENDDESRGRIEARAEAILETVEATFPSRFIHQRLAESGHLSEGAKALLARVPDHDFLRHSIRNRVSSQQQLTEGLDDEAAEAAVVEVEAVERVSRITERADEVVTLVGTGVQSALQIAATPRAQFVRLYGEALGGRPQASRIHAQAQHKAAGVRLAAIRLVQSLQHAPFVLGAPSPQIKGVPDARTLFQAAAGFCDCEHCGSVYSPAAYFVDLLRYLNVSSPDRIDQLDERLKSRTTAPIAREKLSRYQPLDVLLGRRPDLADLPLTCENTLTTLPYIDLVNELLEATITGTSAAFDTGKTPADVLKAVPQNVSREAYVSLQQSVHPLTLPYRYPLALARAYLAHLGVTRLELIRVLGRGGTAGDPQVVESLGMSPEEFEMITKAPPDLWRHLGLSEAGPDGPSYVGSLTHVPALLEATGITFQNLIELVSTRFINADNGLRLETPTPDCNPVTIELVGLDATRLSRMVRMIRLQRRLGWPFPIIDRALVAFGATDLDPAVLAKVAVANDLAKRLDRPLLELLVLWAPLDAWGTDNQFDRLFTTRAVMWRAHDERTFQLRPDRTELIETSDSLDGVASALLAGFRITSEELALIRALQTRRGAAPRLDVAGLSAVYRVVVLARALQLRIPALDLLLRLTPPEADPFKPGDPEATRRFVEIVREVQASDFTPERLAYLFRHESEPRRDPGPLPAQVDAVLSSIRRGLADAFSETSRPAEVTTDTLRQKLAALLDPSLLDQAIDVLDVRTALPLARRMDFFARNLARIFPDPAAAAARLFDAPQAPALVPQPPAAEVPRPAAALPSSEPAPLRPAAEPASPLPSPQVPAVAATPAAPAAASLEAIDGATAVPPPSPADLRWRANTLFVLDSLLPQLRTRQLRGAIVQTLSDTLGLSVPGTARLLDVVLRSRRRPGEPLLRDFLALLGSGLTGEYFANPDLSGAPAQTRTDPELTFAWAGAPPTDGVPGRRFSARWTGYLLPRSTAPHTFYVQTDGSVRLVLKVNGAERVLIDQPGNAEKASEHASEPIVLDPTHLTEVRLEYRNQGAPAALSLQFGTSPAAKQSVPTTNLYPVDGLSSFEPVEQSYRRLHKAALILTGFGITDSQLEWLTSDPPYLNLDGLPMQADAGADGVALMRRWRQLAGLYALRKKLPRSNADLFDVFRAQTMTEAIDRLVLATGWDRGVVEAFLGADGLAVDSATRLRPPLDPAEEPMLLRLARAVDVQYRVGVAPATLYGWANTMPDADGATTIVQAVKARYDETRWLEVARSLNDPLRIQRRDALVSYLLPRMRELGVKNRNQLFEYFLIDVEMNPCMLTSRIRQATGAVQTFFQRCLMNLEPKVPPRIIDDNDWKWLKNYRVWEANRKVFLYPENWIEPELRDDKSPLFQALESSILQQEIKNDNVEATFADYLEGLDEISRLDVRGVWLEERHSHRMTARIVPKALRAPQPPPSVWEDGTYHVFARTFNAPYVWYYRRLERGRHWTPWEKIDADIEGDHLVPVVYNRRMHLFWTVFHEVTKPVPALDRKGDGPPPSLGKDWEIHLAYSVYDRGRWSRKKLSNGGVVDYQSFVTLKEVEGGKRVPQLDGSRVLSPTDYTLRATVDESNLPRLHLHLYCRSVDRNKRINLSLEPLEVERVATFELSGCNGALTPDRERSVARAHVWHESRSRRQNLFHTIVNSTMGNIRARGGSHPFRIDDGGLVNAPAGSDVDGMGYVLSRRSGGALLTLPAGDNRGLGVALSAPRGTAPGATIVPVTNPKDQGQRGLFPFFFQDRMRSYFARPIYTGWHPPTLVAVPLLWRRRFAPLPSRRRPAPGRFRGGRGRREDVEAVAELTFEALDAFEDEQDEAWHPDDAAEARAPRRRQTPQRPRPARPFPARPSAARQPARRPALPARHFVTRRQAGFHEQQLQFVPFEHPNTCHLISTLKSKGIEGLLDFSTTRPPVGRDHMLDANGLWVRHGSWFQRHYGAGPLVSRRDLPHLDVGFEVDNPYGAYNWELFFHAPLQVAVRLAKDGRHEEAQRWFHFIFDPTTDSSAPSPRRYWRFAPFYENNEYDSAREMMNLLSYSGTDGQIISRQSQVRDQLSAWWEKPFSPHVIARLRIAAYQKAVVMKYIDNLVEWGDKLFRRDSLESIQEATQIYILAANILGPRPEKIPPIVAKEPLTFQKMRGGLNLFSNFEVRLENLQVRRPFRINAKPDVSGATAVLGMATQYFCTPANPQLDKYWDTIADRLFKIRNCMNIQGIVRQLPLFEPPIDPGLLVRAAAAGVDLGSVIASLNAPPPHYRFPFLHARAVRLAEEIRSFGKMTLAVLERRDAEGLASLRASGETRLLDAVRDIRKKQVRQVEEALAEQGVERERIDLQMQHLNTQLQQLMNPQEEAKQKSLSASQVFAGISEGIDLAAKVAHAIPEIQAGAAGGFSSPFTTVQLGGEMFGSIAEAFSSSIEKLMSKSDTEADLAETQAEYQRRREEWQHELEVLGKEKAQIDKRIAETQLKLEISSAELHRHDVEVENSQKVQTYLRDKYTNEQLYAWMLGQLSAVYFQAYKVAFDAAQQAERAFRFERGDTSSSFIEFSYWDSLKKGLFAGERLLLDLRRLESAHVEGDRRALEITRHISLREDFPTALQELLATGRCQIEVTEALLDGDFPGHYFRRIKSVSLTVSGAVPGNRNVNCTVTLLENRLRTNPNASGSYAPSADGEDARFLVNPVPVQAVATSRPDADAGLFHLRFDDERYLPFEGAGAISRWRIELPQTENAVDLATIGEIVLTLSYTARSGGSALEAAARADREKGLARGGIKPEAQHMVSLKRDAPAIWKRLSEATPGQDVEMPLPLEVDRFSGRYRGLDVRIERVTVYAQAGPLGVEALRLRLDPPKGSGTPISGWTPPWPKSPMRRAIGEVSGPAGVWKLAASATGARVPDLVGDLVLVFELRARKT